MASERLRQREVHKYYQSWLESSVGFQDSAVIDDRLHSDGTKLSSSNDTALTAFAQLGCLRLNAKRGIVTLISTARLYILAEATINMSLLSPKHHHDAEDDIWFGNASIPRSQGVSGTALTPPEYTAHSASGDSFTARALVINDLTQHSEFGARPYAGNGVSFYCGIPIVTENGSPIGVYSITDDHPRDGLSPSELRHLCGLATAMMKHLDTVRNEAARFRGELMVLGLGRFNEGASTISSSKLSKNRLPRPLPQIDLSSQSSSTMFKGMNITAADPSALHTVERSETKTPDKPTSSDDATGRPATAHTIQASKDETFLTTNQDSQSESEHSELHRRTRPGNQPVFTRAANILRECCAADGVLFFDAVSTNLAKRSSTSAFRSENKSSPEQGGGLNYARMQREGSPDSHTSGPGDSEEMDSGEETNKACTLLGFSVDVTEQTHQRTQDLKKIAMTESILRRLIRRYPQGKTFYFSPEGNLSSSENDTAVSSATSDGGIVGLSKPTPGSLPAKRFKSKFAEELKRLVPQAQSVIWLPLWDFSKQRWSAGAFLWTKLAERLIVAQDDLVYLKTFANSIMIEVARQDAAVVDDTKTTFIANISHELRSPLHGVIGSCDLLKDTQLDEHQASLVKAIEMCGKTLNDTVDHVLDYTKINQYVQKGGPLLRPGASKGRSGAASMDNSVLEDDFDLAALIQEAVESVCASQSAQHRRLRDRSSTDKREAESPSTTTIQKQVQVIFDLAHQNSWRVRSQPGAIKRILTNLVQNALKYTDSGTITISLSTQGPSAEPKRRLGQSAREMQEVTIAVRDTGKGMSKDFVQNHAFTPFSQESSFSDGTGLGLSIVQLIVDSLGGKIELNSSLKKGTEIKIRLRLLTSTSSQASSDVDLQSISTRTAGKSLCLIYPTIDASSTRQGKFSRAISAIATSWLGMRVEHAASFETANADFYMYTSNPRYSEVFRLMQEKRSTMKEKCLILVVFNAAEKLKLKKEADRLGLSDIVFDIVIHPVGPQKLGEVFDRCLQRQTVISATLSREASRPSSQQETLKLTTSQQRDEEMVSQRRALSERTHRPSTPSQEQQDSIRSHRERLATQPSQIRSTAQGRFPSAESPRVLTQITSPLAESTEPTATSDPLPSTNKRVLLVDDNAINLNILKAAMKKGKYAFDTANDGLEALEAFKQAALSGSDTELPFTHVLMDISMPVMDGIESTRYIRQFEREQQIDPNDRHVVRRGPRSERGFPIMLGAEKPPEDMSPISVESTTPYDMMESLPMSPLESSSPVLSIQQSHPQSRRPFLSHFQAGEPRRAVTYSARIDGSHGLHYSHQQPPQRAMIIALSGVAVEQTQKDMFAAGADMFLAKPIKLKELLKILDGQSGSEQVL